MLLCVPFRIQSIFIGGHFYDIGDRNDKCCILFDKTAEKQKQVNKMNDEAANCSTRRKSRSFWWKKLIRVLNNT